MSIRFDIITLFPELFASYLGQSLLKRAIAAGLVEVHAWDLRNWTLDRHRKVDDRPYGGGPGMVISPQPVFSCVEELQAVGEPGCLIELSPQGERLTQSVVADLARERRLLLLCGRYEGFDERVRLGLKPRLLSVGDFICNGGEVPAMVVIDTVIRLIPGVLGDEESAAEDSFSAPDWIEYPQYTRPPVFRGMEVPEVLLGGNHQEIARWRAEQARARSERRKQEMKGTNHVDQSPAGTGPAE